ncbi:hypothetical protein [Verrucosispora sp. WMMC514]|uniref:hypothetical protein n=1 Tax=Verrucosispora sp. WMMC514 TaxID=3015156 RepID=UPI00248CE59C|nr:hypothetical protein [Verrucosispora sp. WMMC514]WBB94183.1 hypothetical protein O7597_15140 [Verrucosispora sp. WMMC514]
MTRSRVGGWVQAVWMVPFKAITRLWDVVKAALRPVVEPLVRPLVERLYARELAEDLALADRLDVAGLPDSAERVRALHRRP